jgi:iron complex transport system substrate-binding protein
MVLLVAAGCGSSEGAPDSTSETSASETTVGGWSFIDARGVEIALESAPDSIVADTYTAASLWDFGVRPVGVFGWGLEEEESAWANSLGSVDLDQVEVVGVGDQLNIEAVAALEPDLIVGYGPVDPTDDTVAPLIWVSDENMPLLEDIAPPVATKWFGVTLVEALDFHEDLAGALGADLDDPALVQAKTDFESAVADLGALAEGSELTLMAVSAGPDGIWVANPPGFAILGFLSGLGFDVVVPENPDGPWELLSWENVNLYPADVLLFVGNNPLETGILDDQPTWLDLPAVEAEQVVSFNDKWPFNYEFYAEALSGMADSLEDFEPLD